MRFSLSALLWSVYYVLQLLHIDMDHVNLLPGQSQDEIGPIQTGNAGSFFLRDISAGVPEDRCCQTHLAGELLG